LKKIAIIRFSAIGDVALWLPVVRRALVLNPQLHITFITKKNTAFLYNHIDRLQVIGVDLSAEYKGIFGLKKLANFINHHHTFDVVVDGHDVLRSKILYFLLKANHKITFKKGRAEKQQFINGNYTKLPHTTIRYADALQKAGLQIDTQFEYPNIIINDADAKIANEFINQLPTKKIIGFAPFAMHKGKVMPTAQLEKVMMYYHGLDYLILIFGSSANDDAICAKWMQQFTNLRLTNSLNFAQEVHVMQACHCIVAMDSANMHIASLQGIPVVSIWGATDAKIGFAPLFDNEKYIVEIPSIELPCRPCAVFGNKPCALIAEPYACFTRIKTQQIIDTIASIP
jgi:ADP-heptose:LPS heptosyltransferase